MTTPFEQEVEAVRQWFASPRFKGLTRIYSAREIVEQRGTIRGDYSVAKGAAPHRAQQRGVLRIVSAG